jgi:hypothetical protein
MIGVGTGGTWSVRVDIALTYGSGMRSDRDEKTCASFTKLGPSAAIDEITRSARTR